MINSEKKKNLIWFHVASLGEIKSIYEIVKHYQSFQNLNILITSVTTSSSQFFDDYLKSNNTIHQFAPLDSPIIIKKFLNHWEPKISIFIDSELWPNMIFQTSKSSKMILLNCRISKNSFQKWKIFKLSFFKIVNKFNAISVQSNETRKYLEFFGIKKINNLGNLKYTFNIKKNLELFNIEKNKFNWAGMSIHFNEIDTILNVHKKISYIESNITTFLIPRHLNKLEEIKKKIEEQNITFIETSKNNNIIKFNGIVLVDQFGVADEIFDKVKLVFMGGSFIDHGGQNPIEPAKYGSRIFYGPNIHNFTEIYEQFDKKNISKMVKNEHELYKELEKYINKDCQITIEESFDKFSKEILASNIGFLDQFINLYK
ncbi:MAG: glycosyltransferase N-terminal domain-containing protein [Opitutae bacterium]